LNMRFAWLPAVPTAWIIPSLILTILGFAFSSWAMVANRYFSSVVRLQSDRGQTVVSEGPYHFVRHPGYAGAAIGYLFTPWALSSFWAIIPAALLILALLVRTAREDRLLQSGLPGYFDYTKKTCYRWLPGIW
jgi:protein-S-isoprenylcysteine O-methyltransferase Ste14